MDSHPGRVACAANFTLDSPDNLLSAHPYCCEQYYYAMEDYVFARQQQGAKWNWSTYRPGPIIGYSLGCV